MLICIQSYQLVIKGLGDDTLPQANAAATGLNIEVVLVIDYLHVISFDRFAMKLPSSV